MPGSIIIKTEPKEQISELRTGLIMVEAVAKGVTTIAEIISVGDDRADLRNGMKIVFPTATGLLIAPNIYYLKYADICAVVKD